MSLPISHFSAFLNVPFCIVQRKVLKDGCWVWRHALIGFSLSDTCIFLPTIISGLRSDFEGRCHGAPGENTGPLVGRNLPEVVNRIVWVRQLIHKVAVSVCLSASPFNVSDDCWPQLQFPLSSCKVEDSIRISEALLADLSAFRSFLRFCDDLLEVLRAYEQEQFEDWSREILSGLADPKSGIRWGMLIIIIIIIIYDYIFLTPSLLQ